MTDILDNQPEAEKKTPKRKAAVALSSEALKALPKITAAGYGKVAEQIVELAFQNGVKVREDADLAEMLAAVDVDSDIPTEALVAVAEILAYIYKANGTYQSMLEQEKETP